MTIKFKQFLSGNQPVEESFFSYRHHVMKAAGLHEKNGDRKDIIGHLKAADNHPDMHNYDKNNISEVSLRSLHKVLNKIYRSEEAPSKPLSKPKKTGPVTSKGSVDVFNKDETSVARIPKHLLNSYEEEFLEYMVILDESSKNKLTSYTKAASKDLADKERNFYNQKENDFSKVLEKASKIAQRKLGIEQAQNKLASGEYEDTPSKVTMKAHYKPKEKPSKVSKEAMSKLNPDYSTDNKQVKEDINECNSYSGDYDYHKGDKSKEYETHYESFSDAIEAAKKHANNSGFQHDPEEFDAITSKGFIKPKDKKIHAFHVSLKDKEGNDMKKVHSFQITGHGNSKFSIVQDIK